jgi:hypothetical protein
VSVLLVTRSDDNASVKLVAEALRRQGEEAIRLDTDRYPELVRLATRISEAPGVDGRPAPVLSRTLETAEGTFDLEAVSALWYRRYFAGGALPAALGDLRTPAVDEARRSMYGMIAALPCFQLDPLESVRRCDHKELQLIRGRALGLDVPRTLFTNDPAAARAFFEECHGRVVTKMQSSFAVYREGQENVVFTSVVERGHLEDLEGLRYCPMTFQEHLPKALELRATVVGSRVMTAAVDSQRLDRTKVDWRKDGVALLRAWTPYQLPAAVEGSLRALLAEIGLNYGAADFVVTPDGRHVFLEVNAGGEWFWLDESQPGSAGLPIAASIAAVLTTPAARLSAPG